MNYENDKTVSNVGTDFSSMADKKRYMLSELERLKNEWDEKTRVDIPELKTYERREYLDVDRDSVKHQVESESAAEFASAVNDAKNESDKKINAKSNAVANEKSSYTQKIKELGEKLEKDVRNSANDMIKQGIARSSIATGEEEGLRESYEATVLAERERSETKIKGLELEKALLEKEFKNDLENLKISHATKVQNKIDKIVGEIDKENQKIFEYNNKIAMQEQKDKKEIARIQSNALAEKYQQMRDEAKYGYSGEKKENYLQRLDIARDYFNRLDKEQALKELQENEKMYEYLGLYYNRLLSETMTRR